MIKIISTVVFSVIFVLLFFYALDSVITDKQKEELQQISSMP